MPANKKIKVGVTDCSKYKNYEDWLMKSPHDIEVVKLSCLSSTENEVQELDGLILSGGEDVHPKFYNSPENLAYLNETNISEQRDVFEMKIIEKTLAEKKPILGICRGLQIMNVYLGGTLIYDLPQQLHLEGHGKIDGQDQRHAIKVEENSLLQNLTHTNNGEVNSAHHQSALMPAPGLISTAFDLSQPAVIEALEWQQPFNKSWLLLVQWHPERMPDQHNVFAQNIREEFIGQML